MSRGQTTSFIVAASLLLSAACGEGTEETVPSAVTTPEVAAPIEEAPVAETPSTPLETGPSETAPVTLEPADFFVGRVVSFEADTRAGFGADGYPDIVYGPPRGAGASSGSLDVLSLGVGGSIVVEFPRLVITDGPGVDFIVFENPLTAFMETGIVSVSEDGVDWREFPCDSENRAERYPGCAGVNPVLSHPDNGIDPRDPTVSGGDAFDLADVGLTKAKFVRIQDSGKNRGSGFDLDAISVVHGEARPAANR